jgi:hypothetical protein
MCADLVITHALEWPSLTVQWLPVCPTACLVSLCSTLQYLPLGLWVRFGRSPKERLSLRKLLSFSVSRGVSVSLGIACLTIKVKGTECNWGGSFCLLWVKLNCIRNCISFGIQLKGPRGDWQGYINRLQHYVTLHTW